MPLTDVGQQTSLEPSRLRLTPRTDGALSVCGIAVELAGLAGMPRAVGVALRVGLLLAVHRRRTAGPLRRTSNGEGAANVGRPWPRELAAGVYGELGLVRVTVELAGLSRVPGANPNRYPSPPSAGSRACSNCSRCLPLPRKRTATQRQQTRRWPDESGIRIQGSFFLRISRILAATRPAGH